MKKEFENIANELLGVKPETEFEWKGATDRAIIGMMVCKRLDRIANKLESLDEHLATLSDCVGSYYGSSKLRVAGAMEHTNE